MDTPNHLSKLNKFNTWDSQDGLRKNQNCFLEQQDSSSSWLFEFEKVQHNHRILGSGTPLIFSRHVLSSYAYPKLSNPHVLGHMAKLASSRYTSVDFFSEDLAQKMMTVKIDKNGDRIQRVYVCREQPLGVGGNGAAYLYTCVKSSNGMIGKAKVVKVPLGKDRYLEKHKNAISWGKIVLDEQLVNPLTGTPVKRVPGLITRIKNITDNGSALLSFYDHGNLISSLGKLSYGEIINAVSQLLFGLKHLHTATEKKPALLHRDIKPENIFQRKGKDGKIEYAIADLDGAHLLLQTMKLNYSYTREYVHGRDYRILSNSPTLKDKIRAKRKGVKAQKYSLMNPAQKILLNQSQDIYGIGVCMRQLLTGKSIDALVNGDMELIRSMEYVDISKITRKSLNSAQKLDMKTLCTLINQMTNSKWYKRCSLEQAVAILNHAGITFPDYDS